MNMGLPGDDGGDEGGSRKRIKGKGKAKVEEDQSPEPAEQESEQDEGQGLVPGTSEGLPRKKKRTRILPTAHQAAALYALLARSRFPTTAMREEVGKAIGLSPRKVQVWFQNQRQKARRLNRSASDDHRQASALMPPDERLSHQPTHPSRPQLQHSYIPPNLRNSSSRPYITSGHDVSASSQESITYNFHNSTRWSPLPASEPSGSERSRSAEALSPGGHRSPLTRPLLPHHSGPSQPDSAVHQSLTFASLANQGFHSPIEADPYGYPIHLPPLRNDLVLSRSLPPAYSLGHSPSASLIHLHSSPHLASDIRPNTSHGRPHSGLIPGIPPPFTLQPQPVWTSEPSLPPRISPPSVSVISEHMSPGYRRSRSHSDVHQDPQLPWFQRNMPTPPVTSRGVDAAGQPRSPIALLHPGGSGTNSGPH